MLQYMMDWEFPFGNARNCLFTEVKLWSSRYSIVWTSASQKRATFGCGWLLQNIDNSTDRNISKF